MHPPLLPEKHPMCKDLIYALLACHKEHNVAKWWGACNDIKFALSKCFTDEKKVFRAERMQRAKDKYRERLEAHRSRMEAGDEVPASAATQ